MSSGLLDLMARARIADLDLEHSAPIDPDAPLGQAYESLDDGRRAALVVCEGAQIVGIFTQRDVLLRTALEDLPLDTALREVMTPDPVTLPATAQLTDALGKMVEGGFRQIPLVDSNGSYAGLLRSRDILRYVAGFFPEAVLNLPPRLRQHLPTPEGG